MYDLRIIHSLHSKGRERHRAKLKGTDPKIMEFGSYDNNNDFDLLNLLNSCDNAIVLSETWARYLTQLSETLLKNEASYILPSSYIQVRLDDEWEKRSKAIRSQLYIRSEIERQLANSIQELAKLAKGNNCIGGSLVCIQHNQPLKSPDQPIVKNCSLDATEETIR